MDEPQERLSVLKERLKRISQAEERPSVSSFTTDSSDNRPIGSILMMSDRKPFSKFQLKDALPPSDPNCLCNQLFDSNDSRKCTKCCGEISIVKSLIEEYQITKEELEHARARLKVLAVKPEDTTHEMVNLRLMVDSLEAELVSKGQEIDNLRTDLDIIGEKLIDEITKRAELQSAKDVLSEELEDLTKSLFEEANTMVANEARQRAVHQEREISLEQELKQTLLMLKAEQNQSRELRTVIAKMEREQEDKEQEKVQELVIQTQGFKGKKFETETDPMQLALFEEFLTIAPKLKLAKLHSATFMKNALEDDVTPCLRFGGNPRTSTKKFIDAIVSNSCFIEEMSHDVIDALYLQDQQLNDTQTPVILDNEAKTTIAPTPTASLFNKTVFERLTTAIASTNLSSLGSAGEALVRSRSFTGTATGHVPGCSACTKQGEPYRYHFKISDVTDDQWFPICLDCKGRLVAVNDFYEFIRCIRQGLYASRSSHDLFLESIALKKKMFFARLGINCEDPEKVLDEWTSLKPVSPQQVE